jgi:hypothetical protein
VDYQTGVAHALMRAAFTLRVNASFLPDEAADLEAAGAQ